MIIWNNEALQISSLLNGLSDPGNRKRTFHKIKIKFNEMKLFSLRSESRKPYQRTRVRCFVCKEDEICETNFRYESAHKCSNWWLGSRRRRMRIVKTFFFSENKNKKPAKISWFEFVDVNWRYRLLSCTNDLTFKQLRNMRETTPI